MYNHRTSLVSPAADILQAFESEYVLHYKKHIIQKYKYKKYVCTTKKYKFIDIFERETKHFFAMTLHFLPLFEILCAEFEK
jgi:hypothetical protein